MATEPCSMESCPLWTQLLIESSFTYHAFNKISEVLLHGHLLSHLSRQDFFNCKNKKSSPMPFTRQLSPGLSAALVTQRVVNLPAMQETQVWSLDQEDPLEKGMATHSSILSWRVPRTEEPGGLQSMGSQGVGHNWEINTPFFSCHHFTLRSPLCTIINSSSSSVHALMSCFP